MTSKMFYQWKSGTQTKVPADIAGAEIERVRLEHAGRFKPSCLVEESRPENAPLHNEFVWNDKVAAQDYRNGHAEYLIRRVVVAKLDGTE